MFGKTLFPTLVLHKRNKSIKAHRRRQMMAYPCTSNLSARSNKDNRSLFCVKPAGCVIFAHLGTYKCFMESNIQYRCAGLLSFSLLMRLFVWTGIGRRWKQKRYYEDTTLANRVQQAVYTALAGLFYKSSGFLPDFFITISKLCV